METPRCAAWLWRRGREDNFAAGDRLSPYDPIAPLGCSSRSAVAAPHNFRNLHHAPCYVLDRERADEPGSFSTSSEMFLRCITRTILDIAGSSVLQRCATGGKRVVNGSSGIVSAFVREVQDSSAA